MHSTRCLYFLLLAILAIGLCYDDRRREVKTGGESRQRSIRRRYRQMLKYSPWRARILDKNQVETSNTTIRLVIRNVDDDIAVDDALSTTADVGDVKFRPRDFVWTQTERRYAIRDRVHGTLKHGFPIANEVRVKRIRLRFRAKYVRQRDCGAKVHDFAEQVANPLVVVEEEFRHR